MKWCCLLLFLSTGVGAAAEVVVFRDGTRMEVRTVELREELALITDLDGNLFSVPRQLLESDPSTIVDIRGWALRMAQSVHRAAETYRAKSPHDRASALVADALTEGFATDRFVHVAAEAFAERSKELLWSEILPRLHSPLVQRMERLERAERALSILDGSEARLELVVRLDRATGTSDIALELQGAMTASLLDGINSGRSAGHQKVDWELESAVGRVRETLESRTRETILASLFDTYQGVTDEELREYVEFLESENGLALSQAILESLLVAIQDSSRRTSQILSVRAQTFGRTRI